MNYIKLQKFSLYKLNTLKEELIQDISNPEGVISYSGTHGSYLITPFGPHTYSVNVSFNDEEIFNKFIKNILNSPLSDMFQEDTMVDSDPVIKYFVVKAFINEAHFDDVQIELKKVLNEFIPSIEDRGDI